MTGRSTTLSLIGRVKTAFFASLAGVEATAEDAVASDDDEGVGGAGRRMTDLGALGCFSSLGGSTSNATRRSNRGELGRVEGAVDGGVAR